MKITKYPQSCMRVEHNSQALMIDIGEFAHAKANLDEYGQFDALLITHSHFDHINQDVAETIAERGVAVFCNQDVATQYPQLNATVVEDGQSFIAADMSVAARELPHCVMPDGSPGPQNTGFVIEGALFHAGDGVAIENLQVPTLAAAVAGPSISLRDTVAFATQVGAQKLIPMHYDNPVFFNDPKVLDNFDLPFEIVLLANGESVEV